MQTITRHRFPRFIVIATTIGIWACTGTSGEATDALAPDFSDAGDASSDDASSGQPTSFPRIEDTVTYLPYKEYYIGTGDIIFDRDIVIDTDAMTIDGATYSTSDNPGSIVFDWHWVDRGTFTYIPKLAILHVRDLVVTRGTTVRCIGEKPLFILAETLTVEGFIDASAHGEVPGCGGRPPYLGYGHELLSTSTTGRTGQRSPFGGDCQGYENPPHHTRDAGGGGAGHAARGGAGGSTNCRIGGHAQGGVGGDALTGDIRIDRMLAGSGGGHGSAMSDDEQPGSCAAGTGGGGGGGLNMYARTRLLVSASGGMGVGGGGGMGGVATGSCINTTAGGGGGSGGTIILQSPSMTIRGTLAANGGAGGSGAEPDEGPEASAGMAGQDGLMATTAALGGVPGSAAAGAGGAGGALLQPQGQPGEHVDWNGGGGGGGVGRILVRAAEGGIYDDSNAAISPAPVKEIFVPGDAPDHAGRSTQQRIPRHR